MSACTLDAQKQETGSPSVVIPPPPPRPTVETPIVVSESISLNDSLSTNIYLKNNKIELVADKKKQSIELEELADLIQQNPSIVKGKNVRLLAEKGSFEMVKKVMELLRDNNVNNVSFVVLPE